MDKQNENHLNELPDELVDTLSGGLILDLADGSSTPLVVVDDQTGEIITWTNRWKGAYETTAHYGLSDEVINREQFKERFGRDFLS